MKSSGAKKNPEVLLWEYFWTFGTLINDTPFDRKNADLETLFDWKV